jgi:hypothetical protein
VLNKAAMLVDCLRRPLDCLAYFSRGSHCCAEIILHDRITLFLIQPVHIQLHVNFSTNEIVTQSPHFPTSCVVEIP